MDQNQLVARVLREAASARAAVTASYQRLWRPANSSPPDRQDAEPSDQTPGEPAIGDQHSSEKADSG
jgi:hypothetical protein